ncbi:MAG: hypothetical protein ACYDHG_12585 [Desulfomonilaceae bacterium]
MKTGAATIRTEGNENVKLPAHSFEDPAFQAEFDALTDLEDRLDYLVAFKAFTRPEPEETITLEEMKALLEIE